MAYTKKTNTTEKVKDEFVKKENTNNAESDEKVTAKTVKNVKTSEDIVENKEEKVATPREYDAEDLIPCRSLTKGELICVGKKTKETYIWADYGDITEVEYQDLLALKASKSSFIFDTLFIIDDEELLETNKWKDVKALYESIYSEDVETLINMNLDEFRHVFPTLPNGLKKAVMTEVATQMEAGTFDSIQKVKMIDEICGTDLSTLF